MGAGKTAPFLYIMKQKSDYKLICIINNLNSKFHRFLIIGLFHKPMN